MKPLDTSPVAPAPAHSSPPIGFAARLGRMLVAADDRAVQYAALLGFAVVMFVALPLSAKLNAWLDEAFTLHSTGSGVVYAWHEAILFEAQPPLYFVIEAAWRLIHEGSIAFARFPSAIFAAAAVAVIVVLGHRVAPRVPPAIVALIVALNPIVIWAATEMRVYALALLIGSVLTWMFFEGFLAPQPSRRARVVYVIAAIAGLYTQYFIGAFFVAHAVTLLVLRRAVIRPLGVAMAIVCAAFAPFIGIVLEQVRGSGGFVTRVSILGVPHELVNDVFTFLLPHDIGWSGAVKYTGFCAAFVLIVFVAWCRPVVSGVVARGMILQWFVCLVVLGALLKITGLPPAPERHIIAVVPSTLIVGLLVFASLTRRRVAAASFAGATFAVFAASLLWMQYRPPIVKHGDWQRIAAFLRSQPSAPVAVFPAEFAVALNVYLPEQLVPVPTPMPFTADYVFKTALRDEADVSKVLDPVRSRSNELWLISSGVCTNTSFEMREYHCQYLGTYLQSRYHLVRTVAFRGALAQLYRRTADTRASVPMRNDADQTPG